MPGLKSAQRSPNTKSRPSKADKSTDSAAASSSPAKPGQPAADSTNGNADSEEDKGELLRFAETVAQNAHLLVRGRGDEQLAQHARDVLKRSFDQGAFIPTGGEIAHAAELTLRWMRHVQLSSRNRSPSLT